jgi:hypothetical protein
MTGLEWFLAMSLFAIYVTCLFTVCFMTFRKGYTLLGILGIFLPILWLIGAILPAKHGSRYWVSEGIARQQMIDEYTR